MSDWDELSEDLESDIFSNLHPPKVHMGTVLQIWFIPHTSKHWTDYMSRHNLSKRNVLGTKIGDEEKDKQTAGNPV